jgi:hypothetical protein
MTMKREWTTTDKAARRQLDGFTLVEVSASVTIMIIAFGLAFGGFLYALKRSTSGDVQNELDIDVQRSMERLKYDLRLSSLDKIFYYPVGPGPYQAISFPLARDDDGDGLVELDADGNIIWDKTLVYHIWPSSPHQLRVTTFDPRDNNLTDAQRQAQLEAVVSQGTGAATYNGDNSSYTVLFENLLDWSITPRQAQIDCYSPTLKREKASLGYVLLDGGYHDFTFTVKGKNASSSGYHIGIDQLIVSPSYGEREAEAQIPTAQSGASATIQYMGSGSWKGNYQLLFPATSPSGHRFTLTMDNDRWEETNFRGIGYTAEDVTIAFNEALNPMDFVLQLSGMDDTWTAAAQCGSARDVITDTTLLPNAVVRIMLKGSELEANGNWLNYNGQQCRLTFEALNGPLKMDRVYIGECASSNTVSPDFLGSPESIKQVTFGGNTSTEVWSGVPRVSDWIRFPIDVSKNYIVSYRISDEPGKQSAAIWHDTRAVTDGFPLTTWIYPNAPAGAELANHWSGHVTSTHLLGLSRIQASYPEKGVYTSQIYDTHLEAPVFDEIRWNDVLPAGTSISIKERSYSDIASFANTNDWEAISAKTSSPAASTAPYKRYIQFQATLRSDSNGFSTPLLKDITIDWAGERSLVEIGGTFTKGPNYGIFELTVNGEPLRSGLTVDLEIYKDIYTFNKGTKRVTSSLRSEIIPRNTGK